MTHILPSYYGWVAQYLRTTANTRKDIIEALLNDEDFIEDVVYENELDENNEEQVNKVVEELAPLMANQLINDLKQEQATWGKDTDNVRLTRALKSLEPDIISFEGTFCCGSCGFYEVRENYKNHEYPDAKGFIFYNQQTVDTAYDIGELYFSYDSFLSEANEEAELEVAQRLVDALKNEGFSVEWNGSTSTTIKIGIRWQRAFPDLQAEPVIS